jgi:hypothetical protein
LANDDGVGHAHGHDAEPRQRYWPGDAQERQDEAAAARGVFSHEWALSDLLRRRQRKLGHMAGPKTARRASFTSRGN